MTISEIPNKKPSLIDMRLLPIKIHYFLAFGALAGVLPYLPVLAKSLNIHATAVGIIYTVTPFIVLLAKPLFGSISDHFQNIKRVIMVLLFSVTIIYLFILLIPPIKLHHQESFASIKCQDTTTNITLPVHYNPNCMLHKLAEGGVCNIVAECATTHINESCNNMDVSFVVALNSTTNISLNVCYGLNEMDLGSNDIHSNLSRDSVCNCLTSKHFSLNCTPSFGSCIVKPEDEDLSEVYRSFQFWALLLFIMIGNSGSAAIFSLSDAACYELLGDKTELYGRQRLFATISWGAIAFLTGYFNDLASASFGVTSYAPGFFLLAAMAALDLIILWRVIDLKQSTYSGSIWSDVSSLFSSCRVVAFAMGVMIIGGLSGILWNYQFWYLQNLGASQLLLGLTITVQCLAAEVPFFFFSGWIIERLGHSLCLIFTFVAFALRYYLYYLLTDPWYTLPIEILHGWTFGVFYSAMTSYASHYAPPGTEATMQGVLGGLFEGLGLAIGSLLSGVGFDQLGGRNTFLAAAVVSAVSSLAFSIVTFVLRRPEPTR